MKLKDKVLCWLLHSHTPLLIYCWLAITRFATSEKLSTFSIKKYLNDNTMRQVKHTSVDNFGTTRDILIKIFWGWSPQLWCGLIMKWWVWQHHLASHAHLTKASADFKHYAKKLGRHQKFSKFFLLVKTEAPSFQKEV